MDIISRLKEFIVSDAIPVTQFADKCNISRSTLSQILNGRNKKISDEIISKIHSAYPNLSIYWLMFGEGKMYEHEIKTFQSPNLFDSVNSIPLDFKNPDNSHEENSILKSQEDIQQNYGAKNHDKNNRFSCDETTNRTNHYIEKDYNNSEDRKIIRIVVFYSDNSYETFNKSEI